MFYGFCKHPSMPGQELRALTDLQNPMAPTVLAGLEAKMSWSKEIAFWRLYTTRRPSLL